MPEGWVFHLLLPDLTKVVGAALRGADDRLTAAAGPHERRRRVADGAVKPQSSYSFEEVSDRLRVVAHTSETFPVRYLADYDGPSDVLDREMLSGLRIELEHLMFGGDPPAAIPKSGPGS